MTINEAVAQRIDVLMQDNAMTQYKLEKKSGLTHGAINGILLGMNKTVTLTTIYKLAKAFGMTINKFLDEELFAMDKVEFE